MDDSELKAIRAARLQEMQRNAQGGGSSNKNGTDNVNGSNNSLNDSIMNQILDAEAKERLNRVRMVKPERVSGVENYLIRLYQSGSIRTKVTEQDIVEILDKIANEERKSTTTRIKFERREYVDTNYGSNKTNNNNKNDSDSDDFFDE